MDATVISLTAVLERRCRAALAREYHSAIERDANGYEFITIEPGYRLAFDVPVSPNARDDQ